MSYVPISLQQSLSLVDSKHASHCMIYSTPDSDGVSYGLLQMRFDGLIGFAGGEVDVQEVTVEHIILANNRELVEEINYGFKGVTESDWICSHQDSDGHFVQHFFAKELSLDQILELERSHFNAEHFPTESLGLFRVPIADSKKSKKSEKFLRNFLRQKFAGNARQQMIETLKKRKLLSNEDISNFEHLELNGIEDNSDTRGQEVKAMPKTVSRIDYHNQPIEVTFGLMTIRDNGLFDFVGTNYLKTADKNPSFQTVFDGLEKDLGLNRLSIIQNKESEVLVFDNGSSHVFCFPLNDAEVHQVERNFTLNVNFNKTSFGIFRIPFLIVGDSHKGNYMKRFFNGFLKQNFVNNSQSHLKCISDTYLSE